LPDECNEWFGTSKMITAQRRGLILDLLSRNGGGSIVDIAETIGVSSSSVRRDLDHLAALGAITRSRGGAIVGTNVPTTFEPPRMIGSYTLHDEKVAIGRAAAAMVKHGQSVIMDSGTTVLEAARELAARNVAATVCTNDLEVAQVLSPVQHLSVVVLGGAVRSGSYTMMGEPGISFLDRLHADLAFIGIHSLAGGRLSETSIEVATIKRRMIQGASQVIALVDSSKFTRPAFYEVGMLEDVHTLISDDGLAEPVRKMVRDAGVELVLVPVDQSKTPKT